MQQKSILVVDDEPRIVEIVETYLQSSGYRISTAFDGSTALQLIKDNEYSLVILDLMLPNLSGEEICRRIRRTSQVPIIMLTAKVGEEDILKGLDIGADDYIVKPFSPRQLIARVGALLRRSSGGQYTVSSRMTFNKGDLVIDILHHDVIKSGESVNLTPYEYQILVTMARSPQRIFSRSALIDTAFDMDYKGYDRVIDSHIKNLRQKIEDDPKHCTYILTVHGVGYKFGGTP